MLIAKYNSSNITTLQKTCWSPDSLALGRNNYWKKYFKILNYLNIRCMNFFRFSDFLGWWHMNVSAIELPLKRVFVFVRYYIIFRIFILALPNNLQNFGSHCIVSEIVNSFNKFLTQFHDNRKFEILDQLQRNPTKWTLTEL